MLSHNANSIESRNILCLYMSGACVVWCVCVCVFVLMVISYSHTSIIRGHMNSE